MKEGRLRGGKSSIFSENKTRLLLKKGRPHSRTLMSEEHRVV